MKKVKKRNVKVLLEESRGMAAVQTKEPQTVKGEWIFSWKIHLNYRYHMRHSYDKIICFQYFPFDEEL